MRDPRVQGTKTTTVLIDGNLGEQWVVVDDEDDGRVSAASGASDGAFRRQLGSDEEVEVPVEVRKLLLMTSPRSGICGGAGSIGGGGGVDGIGGVGGIGGGGAGGRSGGIGRIKERGRRKMDKRHLRESDKFSPSNSKDVADESSDEDEEFVSLISLDEQENNKGESRKSSMQTAQRLL